MASNIDRIDNPFSIDSTYRAAFPAYKVFIYGQEISSDVMSVRVNQSGGSLERTPSTCQITIANPLEKYTLTHEDMIYVGAYKTSQLEGVSIEEVLRSYSADKFGYEYSNPILGGPKFDSSGNLIIDMSGGFMGKPSRYSVRLPKESLNELVSRILATSSDEELNYTLSSLGFNDLSAEEATTVSQKIVEAKKLLDNKFVSNQEYFGDNFYESSVGYNMKREVINDKLKYFQPVPEREKGNPYFNQIQGKLFNYPMQEGDCVFNLNDPVRVAFRDPFDPRMWYWMFTGFVDSCTETVGSHLDSTLTISCTDVTKMARYCLSNISPGYTDVNLESLLSAVNSIGNSSAGIPNALAYKEIFKELNVIEILELIFFGSSSASQSFRQAKIYEAAQLLAEASDLGDLVQIALFSDLFAISSQDLADLISFSNASDNQSIFEEVKQGIHQSYKSLDQNNSVQLKRFSALKWEGISAPAPFDISKTEIGIPFQKRDENFGVNYIVYGDTDSDLDLSYNAKTVKDLNEWNEIIHHRVKKSDLHDLSIDSVSLIDPAVLSIEKVIEIIGKDIKTYPVGYGGVYYFTPAGLTEKLGTSIIDLVVGTGGVDSFHSNFKDRLTMIYDLAEEMEWRFYATPKGDLVFEHPFYDIDPQEFWETKELSSNLTDTTKQVLSTYEDIFSEAYSGSYEDAEALSAMVYNLNTEDQDLINFMEEPNFSYASQFYVGIDEQLSFSNTNTDKGLVTVTRIKPNLFKAYTSANIDARSFVYKPDLSLVPTLGFRMVEEGVKVYIQRTGSGPEAYLSLKLMQRNAEARNLGIDTIPKFGLMVNRPLMWQYRNYYCNIVSCSHSISWNSDVITTINTNQIRAWTGEFTKDGRPKYRHFGANDKPFSWENFVLSPVYKDKKSGV